MAPAPQDQAGADAVRRSEASRKMASSVNLEAVVATGSVAADSVLVQERGKTSRRQRVGGRVFAWRDGVWSDIAHHDSLRVVSVAAFSDAYFALLRALPELLQPATLQPAGLGAGRRVSGRIDAGGQTTWGYGAVAKLLSNLS